MYDTGGGTFVRRATVEDLPAMLGVMDEALNSPCSEEEMQENLVLWAPRFANEDYLFFVLLARHPSPSNPNSPLNEQEGEQTDGLVVGWCRGGKALPQHCVADGETFDCEVQNMFLSKEYQSRGFGRKLWGFVWNEVLQKFQPKNLVVWSVEDATGFYRKLGGTERERKGTDTYTNTAFSFHNLEPIPVDCTPLEQGV